MVSAEFAVALPAVVLVLAVLVSVVAAGLQRQRCLDSASALVRSVSRGETQAVARAYAARLAPEGAQIESQVTSDLVTATVSVTRDIAWLISVTVSGSAAGLRER